MMKTKKQIFRFLIIRSELWFRLILVVTTMAYVSTDKLLLILTGMIGLLWVMNGWRISLEAYKKGEIITKIKKSRR